MSKQPFEGVKVLDLSIDIAGSYCAKQFADYGADVVKIEKTGTGCPLRSMPPFCNGAPKFENGIHFLYCSTNKRSLTLDLDSAGDREILLELVAESDILIESFSPGTMERWGISYDDLAKHNPALVMASITPFGQTGPYRDFKSSDLVQYAMGGAMHATGLPDREPLTKCPNALLYEAGVQAFYLCLGVWFGARKDGVGDYIDISIMEAQLAGCERRSAPLLTYQYTGDVSKRVSPTKGLSSIVPAVQQCADGFVSTGVGPGRFKDVMRLVGLEHLLEDPEWTPANTAIFEKAQAVFNEAFAAKGKVEWAELLQDNGIICTPISTPADVCADSHWKEREYFVEMKHPKAGTVVIPRGPVRSDPDWWRIRRASPALGEHTEEILAELKCKKAARITEKAPSTKNKAHPLEGVRVFGFTQSWTGPFGCMLLGDLGAEVLRIEQIQYAGGLTRGEEPRPKRERWVNDRNGGIMQYVDREPWGPNGEQPWNRFSFGNAHLQNTHSFTLDFSRPKGLSLLKEILKKCDVFVENNTPTTAPKLGLTHEFLHSVNPGLVIVRAPGFGLTGPHMHWKGFGRNIESAIGHAWLMRYSEAPEHVASNRQTYIMDNLGAYTVASAVMMGLLAREQNNGKGMLVEMAQAEAAMAAMPAAWIRWFANGDMAAAEGNRLPGVIQGCYPCKGEDAWVVITVRDDEEWSALVAAMGDPGWASEAAFADAASRRGNHDAVDERISEWTRTRNSYEVMHLLQRCGVPAGPVMTEAMTYADPHVRSKNFWIKETQKWCGTHEYTGYPGILRNTPRKDRAQMPPAGLGEHNEYVFKVLLGLSDAEYAELEKAEFIGTEMLEKAKVSM